MVQLSDLETNQPIGTITDDQLHFLIDQLEEESEEDQDYYIDAATIEMLEGAGADQELLSVLRSALRGRDGIDIRWTRS